MCKTVSTISIVDDDRLVRDSMKRLLRSLGCTVETFASASDFLESSHLEKTACLIADIQMPEMTGLELYARLLKSARPIPTILITAYPDEDIRAEALQKGVQGYLVKPFRENELIAHVRSVLDEQKGV